MSTPAYSFHEFLVLVLKSLVEKRQSEHIENPGSLPEDPKVLHSAFYQLKRKYSKQFPPLSELHFITAGAFPYSPDLTEALDQLQWSGAITRENPSYEQFTPRQFSDSAAWMIESRKRVVGSDSSRVKALRRAVDQLDHALTTTD